MKIIIYCVECTHQDRAEHDMYYPVHSFSSLTEAVVHIVQNGHEIKMELEKEEWDE